MRNSIKEKSARMSAKPASSEVIGNFSSRVVVVVVGVVVVVVGVVVVVVGVVVVVVGVVVVVVASIQPMRTRLPHNNNPTDAEYPHS